MRFREGRLFGYPPPITADRSDHLFPSTDDGAEMAAAERLLVVRGS